MVKNLPDSAGDETLIPGLGRFCWKRKWKPTPVFLLGKSQGQRSLTGYSPWGLIRVGHDLVTDNKKEGNSWGSQLRWVNKI